MVVFPTKPHFRVADFTGGGMRQPTTRQRASAAYYFGWPLGGVETPAEAARNGTPVEHPSRVAFGRFSMSDAALGLAVGILILWHLGRLPE